jgi:hypothetical protein
MPKFAKGSKEAKEWAKKMADARAIKAGRKPVEENEDVSIKAMGAPELVLPEYFATPTKKGWKLVNPLTQERNLSTRDGQTSVRLSRKPVADAVYLEGDTKTIHLSLFSPKDRETIRNRFLKGIADNSSKSLDKKPSLGLGEIKERGRPEKLPKNIEINKERKAEAKKATAKPKGRPSKYGDDEEARKKAKKEQDRIANQKRTEKRRAEKSKGNGLSDSESSDEELSKIMADMAVVDKKTKPVAKSAGGKSKEVETKTPPPTDVVMRRPLASKPQAKRGTKRKAESPPSEGTGMEGTGSYRGFKRLDQENIILTMDDSGEFPMLIKSETMADLLMLHKELKTQLREAKIGKQSHSTIAEHNDLREKIKQLEDEIKSRKMSGTGKNPKQLKRDIARAREMAMELGTIREPGPAPFVPAVNEVFDIARYTTKQLMELLDDAIEEEDYTIANELITAIDDRVKREEMAKVQLGPMKPKGFLQGGKRVYGEGSGLFSESFMNEPNNKISTTNIKKMPKKSKMTTDSGMGLYAGMAAAPSGRGMYAGEGFFGDLAKSAGKVLAPIAIDAGSKYLKGKLAGSGMCGCCSMCGAGMYAGAPTPALPPSGMGMYAGDGLYAGMATPSGRGMSDGSMCGSTMSGCGMCGGLIYNPSNDPEIEKMNQHIRQVMGHHLQLGMAGKGIFGDIGRWFKKAGRTINRSVIQPVGRAFSRGGPLEQVGKQIGGFVIRKGLPALANLATDVIGQPELGALATPLASKGADALATSLGVGMGGKPKKSSPWIEMVKKVQKEKGVSYKEAMSIASKMRKN